MLSCSWASACTRGYGTFSAAATAARAASCAGLTCPASFNALALAIWTRTAPTCALIAGSLGGGTTAVNASASAHAERSLRRKTAGTALFIVFAVTSVARTRVRAAISPAR